MAILGINAYHGDASAAAVVDGRLVAAAEEERFTRVKHAAGFPSDALRYVYQAAQTSWNDVQCLAVARDSYANMWAKARNAVRLPKLLARRVGVQSRFASIGKAVEDAVGSAKPIPVERVEHHRAHLASAFYVSPFDEAAVISIDGLGDFSSAMWGVGRGNRIFPFGAVNFPHSLGIYYTALTQYLGFPKWGDEYKVMGLASYGEPEMLEEFRRMVIAPNGGRMDFELCPDYFVHHNSVPQMAWGDGEPMLGRLYSRYLEQRLGKAREPHEPIEDRHKAIAASLQRRLEEVMLDRLRQLRKVSGVNKLCLAGGVAFNCVANGKILKETGFDELFVPPAAGDAGLAMGAAMYLWHQMLGNPRDFVMDHAYWGPEFTGSQIAQAINGVRDELSRQRCDVFRIDDEEALCRFAASEIAAGNIVGWFQGRMEWGPRALGNRSILADPRRCEMRDILNSKIKRREPFRPFAPSILEERAGEYFEYSRPSPFMLMACAVRPEKRSIISATTHVDGTGRVQTVNIAQNRLYYRLIKSFDELTGVPVILNTSFNENEPVVLCPEEALDCFLRTKMDLLVMGGYVIKRTVETQVPNSD